MNRQSAIARYRASEKDAVPAHDERLDWAHLPVASPRAYGARLAFVYADLDLSMEQALDMLHRSGVADKDEAEFLTGFYSSPAALHFVGFKSRTDLRFARATQVFGKPDFVHVKADIRLYRGGELAPHDTLVFADGAELKTHLFAVDDSAVM